MCDLHSARSEPSAISYLAVLEEGPDHQNAIGIHWSDAANGLPQ